MMPIIITQCCSDAVGLIGSVVFLSVSIFERGGVQLNQLFEAQLHQNS